MYILKSFKCCISRLLITAGVGISSFGSMFGNETPQFYLVYLIVIDKTGQNINPVLQVNKCYCSYKLHI